MKKENKKPPIYIVDSKISWKVFKELQKRLVKDSGPMPEQIDRILWELLRDNKIYCWFDELRKDDMGLGFQLPKNRDYKVIKNYGK